MPMDRNDFLNAVIDDGIEKVRQSYTRPDQRQKRDGAMAGFEACRGLDDVALLTLLKRARVDTEGARKAPVQNYWFLRLFEAQIEWTLNVLSAAMYEHGQTPLIAPTLRGRRRAAAILNPAHA